MARLTNPSINGAFYEIVDPFDENLKMTEGDVLDWQDILFECFKKGLKTVNHFLRESMPVVGDHKPFIRYTPKTDFEFIDILLRNRSDALRTKFNRDYVYYHEDKSGNVRYRSDKSNLTDWEFLFVELTRYTDYWHKNFEQKPTKQQKKKQKIDALWETLMDPEKSGLENVNLYIPKNPDKSYLYFYSENNPKNIDRTEDKFLTEMMIVLKLCDFDLGHFIENIDETHAKFLPRDYLRARAVVNMYPLRDVPGNKSQRRKRVNKIGLEKKMVEDELKHIDDYIFSVWNKLQTMVEERTGYHKRWIWQEIYSKESINFQITDPITFLMKEYFSKEKHDLMEGREREFPLWQMEKLKKKIGEDEAINYERKYTQHEIYIKMKERLDRVLTEDFKKRVQEERDKILPVAA